MSSSQSSPNAKRRFFRALWRLTRIFWTSADAKVGGLLLALAVVLEFGTVYANVLIAGAQRRIGDSLQEKDSAAFFAAMGFFFNVVDGYLNGRYIFTFSGGYPTRWLGDPRFIVGLALFATGFVVNRQSDEILRRLRRPGESGYSIPYGGLYRWVSCPNYLGRSCSGPGRRSPPGWKRRRWCCRRPASRPGRAGRGDRAPGPLYRERAGLHARPRGGGRPAGLREDDRRGVRPSRNDRDVRHPGNRLRGILGGAEDLLVRPPAARRPEGLQRGVHRVPRPTGGSADRSEAQRRRVPRSRPEDKGPERRAGDQGGETRNALALARRYEEIHGESAESQTLLGESWRALGPRSEIPPPELKDKKTRRAEVREIARTITALMTG